MDIQQMCNLTMTFLGYATCSKKEADELWKDIKELIKEKGYMVFDDSSDRCEVFRVYREVIREDVKSNQAQE